jgi:hypothetical protein
MSNENLLRREAKMMKLERLIAEREGVSEKPRSGQAPCLSTRPISTSSRLAVTGCAGT